MVNGAGLYWLFPAAGALLSGGLFLYIVRRRGLSVSRAAGSFLCGILLALVAARGVCALLNLLSRGNTGGLQLSPDRFSFVGGCAGFCLGAVVVSSRRRKEIPVLLDCLAVPGCLLISFLRFGEIFLDQWGLADVYTLGLPDIADGTLLARFPFALQDAWGIWYLSVSTLAAAVALGTGIFFAFRARLFSSFPAPDGLLFLRCAFLLCCFRLFLELTRMNCLVFWFIHTDQALCALALLGLMICTGLRLKAYSGRFPLAAFLAVLLCLALNGLTQYFMDKPWLFAPLFPDDVFRALSSNLKGFGFSVLFLTALLPVFIHGFLCRKLAKEAARPVN